MFTPWDLLWFFFIFSSLQPVVQKYLLAQARRRTLAKIALKRDATVITLIHRQETLSLLGIPLARYIDIDDSQSVLRAIRETPPGKTIEIILHTPGGLVLAASQIARALGDHDGRVVAVVPHYAMSGGTLIALAADEIILDRHAALGPVDPQLGQYAARSLVEVADRPGRHQDQTLLLADVGRKALRQVQWTAQMLLEKHMDAGRAHDTAELLATGVWTHDHPSRSGFRPRSARSWISTPNRGGARPPSSTCPVRRFHRCCLGGTTSRRIVAESRLIAGRSLGRARAGRTSGSSRLRSSAAPPRR
jgi:ClpP class serine protease